MKHTLEGHKWFPYIAWATFIGFAAFVLFLAISLQSDLENLNNKVIASEEILKSNTTK